MPAKITMKSTKQEMLDALAAAEKEIKELRRVKATPAETAVVQEEQEAVDAATADVETGMFSDEMNAKFQNLVNAIAILDARLKARYEVEGALVDMTTVINAKKQALMALDAEYESTKAAIEADLNKQKTAAAAAAEALRAENEALKASLAQARQREEEEFAYALKRRRQLEEDTYADKMAALEKQKAAAEARLAELTADADAIEALKARVEGFSAELDAKYAAGIEEGKKEAGKEYGYRSSMAEKDHSYEIREKTAAIERLEADVAAKAAKIESLETKLDTAYTQLRDLATKTVESTGGVKVLNTSSDSGGSRK